jgi:hypothetical protein
MSLDPIVYQIALPGIAVILGGGSLLLAKWAGKRLDAKATAMDADTLSAEADLVAKKLMITPPLGAVDVRADEAFDLGPAVFRSKSGSGKSHVLAYATHSSPIHASSKVPAAKSPRGRYRTARSSKTGKFTTAKAD